MAARAVTAPTSESTTRAFAVEGEVRPRSDTSGFDVVLKISEMIWEPISG